MTQGRFLWALGSSPRDNLNRRVPIQGAQKNGCGSTFTVIGAPYHFSQLSLT